MIEHGEEPTMREILTGLAKFAAAAAILTIGLTRCASADTSPVGAVIIGAAGMYMATQATTVCRQDPCNAISHAAAGALIAHFVGPKHGKAAAVLSALALGVAKELADKNFDKKDALATAAGGLLYVSVRW